jgi:hypothetical protein
MSNKLWSAFLWVLAIVVLILFGLVVSSAFVEAQDGCADILVPPPPDNLDPTWVWDADCEDSTPTPTVASSDGRSNAGVGDNIVVIFGHTDYLQLYSTEGELIAQITSETELPYCPTTNVCVYLLSTGEYQINITEADGTLIEIISADLTFAEMEVRTHD